jgi:hypothetical protein
MWKTLREIRNKGDLSWDNITVASRIMLPIYVAFFTIVSLNFLFANLDLLIASPGLSYADGVMGLRAWGLIYAAVVVAMVVALALKNRGLFRYALILGAICMGLWAGTMIAAILFGSASPSAFAWPLFVGAACVASNRSLLKGEF